MPIKHFDVYNGICSCGTGKKSDEAKALIGDCPHVFSFLILKTAERNDINTVFAAIGILAHGREYHEK